MAESKNPMARTILTVCLLGTLCLAQQPQFEEHTANYWREQLREHKAEAIASLAAGKAKSLPMLRVLLALARSAKEKDELVGAVARVCRQLGPLAEPLSERLLQYLRTSPSWRTQYQCGQALASIGVVKPEIVDSLLHHICTSKVPALRAYCAESLAELTPKAAHDLLTAVTADRFTDQAHAVAAFVRIGASVAPELLAELAKPKDQRHDSTHRVAELAMAQLGWQVVTLLEEHGHLKLAQLALREGLLVGEMDLEHYRIEGPAPQPPVQLMPKLHWIDGSGHGHDLTLYRAVEGKRGLRIDRIATYIDKSNTRQVVVQSAVLTRVIALAATRQLVAIGTMKVHAENSLLNWRSTGNFTASIQMELDGKVVLSDRFSGYPTGNNFAEHFLVKAAIVVLRQAAYQLEWSDREISEQDRKFLRERTKEASKEPWWVKDRLKAISEVLGT